MRDSGYIVEHYTMLHSKWSDENPVFGQRCSSIRINGSEGYWFSSNCSEEFPYICMNEEDKFLLPKSTVETPRPSTDLSRPASTIAPAVNTYSPELPGMFEIG